MTDNSDLPQGVIQPDAQPAPRPLEGVHVLEVGTFAFVPAAARVLAEWGATVIKIEDPTHGDPVRGVSTWGIDPETVGLSYLWEVLNRGKRSVGIDLRTAPGHDLLMRLVETTDVFLTNFLPAARRKLRIDIDDVRGHNPAAIYTLGSAHGSRGPEAEDGGFDGVSYWQRAGVGDALAHGSDAYPVSLVGPAFGDIQSGHNLAAGISAALFQRATTGHAAVVETSLLASGLWSMHATITGLSATGCETLHAPPREEATNPLSNIYRTSDGAYVSLAMLQSDRYWPNLCAILGRPDLTDDPRFSMAIDRTAHAAECVEELDRAFGSAPLAYWTVQLARQDGPWTVVRRASEAWNDPQVVANGYIKSVDCGGVRRLQLVTTPVQFDQAAASIQPAPQHGADTEEVLLEHGLTWDDIVRLKDDGAII